MDLKKKRGMSAITEAHLRMLATQPTRTVARRECVRPGRILERRRLVRELRAEGLSLAQIAERLGISPRAVSTHVRAIKRGR